MENKGSKLLRILGVPVLAGGVLFNSAACSGISWFIPTIYEGKLTTVGDAELAEDLRSLNPHQLTREEQHEKGHIPRRSKRFTIEDYEVIVREYANKYSLSFRRDPPDHTVISIYMDKNGEISSVGHPVPRNDEDIRETKEIARELYNEFIKGW